MIQHGAEFVLKMECQTPVLILDKDGIMIIVRKIIGNFTEIYIDFHYGYFIYAAAAIGLQCPEWLSKNRSYILDLVRDYANPSNQDPYFTITRNKDWFEGHSWASGLTVFGGIQK